MAERKYDVTALGELLIDFTENGNSEQGNPLMEANPGGAPCNMLAMIQKLAVQLHLFGKVGKEYVRKTAYTGSRISGDRYKKSDGRRRSSYNACVCTYLPGWRPRFLILSESGSRYDAHKRRDTGRFN